MPGEHTVTQDRIVWFRVNVFRHVIDQITTSIDECFSQNCELIEDTAYNDPQRFDEIVSSAVAENSVTKVAKITGVDPSSLKEKSCCFATKFHSLITINS